MLGVEAPHKTEALIDEFRTQRQVTCSGPTYPEFSTRVDSGLVAALFDFISTDDQDLERSILKGRGMPLPGHFVPMAKFVGKIQSAL